MHRQCNGNGGNGRRNGSSNGRRHSNKTAAAAAATAMEGAAATAFHAFHCDKNLKSSLLGTTSFFECGLSGWIFAPARIVNVSI